MLKLRISVEARNSTENVAWVNGSCNFGRFGEKIRGGEVGIEG